MSSADLDSSWTKPETLPELTSWGGRLLAEMAPTTTTSSWEGTKCWASTGGVSSEPSPNTRVLTNSCWAALLIAIASATWLTNLCENNSSMAVKSGWVGGGVTALTEASRGRLTTSGGPRKPDGWPLLQLANDELDWLRLGWCWLDVLGDLLSRRPRRGFFETGATSV